MTCVHHIYTKIYNSTACCDRDCMIVGFITTYMQLVPIATNVVSSNGAQVRCTIKFVSDLS